MTEKRDAPGVGTPDTSNACIIEPHSIIQQDGAESQVAGINLAGQKAKKRKSVVLPYRSRLYSVAIKCYAEQLVYGFDYTAEQVKKLDKSKSGYHALMILHDRDTVSDGIWAVSTEKPHIHLIVRMADRNKRFWLSSLLPALGIRFRPNIDDTLWRNHGVEPVVNFAGYATYLTHETPEAVRDGKELYSISEIISNLTIDEIRQVRDGYNRVTVGAHTVTAEDLEAMDKQAYDLGLELGDFDGWYGSQGFHVRSNAKMKTVRESYMRGVEARVRDRTPINRLCVYIEGAPNTGKTYAATHALSGRRVLTVGGGGSGKFDNLRADTEAIVVDDDVCPNLLNMTDNYICRAYRRNKDNPVWAGVYFIVTSNLTFESWLDACGIKTHRPDGSQTQHYAAMSSRFFVCRLVSAGGTNHLALTSPSERGSVEEQLERVKMFKQFKTEFDKTIAGYRPGVNKVDYSDIIEPYMPVTHLAAQRSVILSAPVPPPPPLSAQIGIRYNPADGESRYY